LASARHFCPFVNGSKLLEVDDFYIPGCFNIFTVFQTIARNIKLDFAIKLKLLLFSRLPGLVAELNRLKIEIAINIQID